MNKSYSQTDRPGDKGLTRLSYGIYEKTNPRIVFLGKIDTLSAHLSIAIALIGERRKDLDEVIALPKYPLSAKQMQDYLSTVVGTCFAIGSDVNFLGKSAYNPKINERTVWQITDYISTLNAIEITDWCFPVTAVAAQVNLARAITRECEVASYQATLNPNISMYLNRLSDLLFIYTYVLFKEDA